MATRPKLSLKQAVAFVVDNDDLDMPAADLPGIVSVSVVAAVYGVTPAYVAGLVQLCRRNSRAFDEARHGEA